RVALVRLEGVLGQARVGVVHAHHLEPCTVVAHAGATRTTEQVEQSRLAHVILREQQGPPSCEDGPVGSGSGALAPRCDQRPLDVVAVPAERAAHVHVDAAADAAVEAGAHAGSGSMRASSESMTNAASSFVRSDVDSISRPATFDAPAIFCSRVRPSSFTSACNFLDCADVMSSALGSGSTCSGASASAGSGSGRGSGFARLTVRLAVSRVTVTVGWS